MKNCDRLDDIFVVANNDKTARDCCIMTLGSLLGCRWTQGDAIDKVLLAAHKINNAIRKQGE